MTTFVRFETHSNSPQAIYVNPAQVIYVEDLSNNKEKYARIYFSSPADARGFVVVKGNIDNIIEKLCEITE